MVRRRANKNNVTVAVPSHLLDHWNVYLLTCPNGVRYVGQTRQRTTCRRAGHKYDAMNKRKDCRLSAAIREHGMESFRMSILCTASSRDRALEMERHYIEYFAERGTVYNDR